ncbi:TenA family protein [Aureimonas mangrovi]|uniref:TenA family protein n=1 Tax=Aureimonas mangrovi TaxID=2758041 RepID=UPI00163D9D63|nr:TenA family protein [Aureimonas mangrovi]
MRAHQPAAPDFGSPLFAALRAAAGDDWSAYARHGFVERLGNGTLPRAAFLHYLRQDYVFLIHFARAWSLLAFKSTRLEEMRLCAATVHALVDTETRLHVEICAREGIDEAALGATREAPQNLAYTRYVIDRGMAGDGLDLLVALLPCVLGYGEIGARLAAEHGTQGPYGEWVATYAGEEYRETCAVVAALAERLGARLLGPDASSSPRWPELCETFATACRLEADFWAMGLSAGN